MFQFLEFWGHKISMFSVFIGLGILASAFFIFNQLKQMHVSAGRENQVMPAIPLTFVFGVAGGYVADVLFRGGIDALFSNPWKYGLTFYGWLIGGMFFLWFYSKLCSLQYDYLLNLFLPSFALAQALGRIGCFLGGCCYGRPTKIWGVSYPSGSVPYIHHGATPLVPVQLYESAYLFLVFIILSGLIRLKHRGAWYLILVPAGRFLLEFLRDDERGFFLSNLLSPSQWISLILGIAGIGWLRKIKSKERELCLKKTM
ncbi:MAG: prolipoprotein diacylglyceryl transferase [Lentisphaerae bacterium]|nr:prolipoprotein diacylglyceryl transferase [Lentisphaerota bacterium]